MELTIEQALQQGVATHKEGKLQDAERLYRAILQSQPLHPDANHNLGVLAVSVNKADAALPLFKTALEANPKIEQFWLSYIDALIKEQQFENAKQVLEQAKTQGVDAEKLNVLEAQLSPKSEKPNATRVSPPQEQLSSLLEQYQNGRFNEAEKLAVSITNEFPTHQFAWKVLGAVLNQLGRISESVVAKEKAVQLAPNDAEAHYNLGNTLQVLGRLDEAEASYRQAIAVKPDFAEAHYNLGNTLQELGRLDEAEASYIRAIGLKPDYAEAHSNLGNTLKELSRLDEALASYNQAIALKSDFAEAHCNLGNTLKELGRLDEALASYNQAIALKPDLAEAHRYLTTMKKFDARDEQYSKMLELYLNEDISEEQRCHINFGLAKACEDLGNFEQAYTHYGEGNVLRKKLLNYDINNDVKLFRKIKSNYPQIVKNSLESEKFPKNLMPIFIVGMPRSGTTLVEQIISSHSQVTGAGELNFATQFGAAIAAGITEVNNESLRDFRHNYLNKLRDVSNENLIITDKMPQNFRYIGLLAAAFPEAKIIHVKRNPAAVCWANYKQYFVSKSIGYCYAIDDIISYHKLYENLMEFWASTLNSRIYNLDYELLTVNQESEIRQLIDYLGLDWDENCLSPQNNTRSVRTASNLQVRQKVYRGSSEQWKKYKPFLNGALDGSLSQ
ncbi:tetratricopeptide repeat protein [Alphaproteobacteria bacterium]|nr:tetratricopeptide repeat protein [Alphaproteobacteria bacterium]